MDAKTLLRRYSRGERVFTEVVLKGVNLANTDLRKIDLTGADLTGANLTGADLSGAELVGAKLAGAKLSDANMTRADLSESDLFDARMNDSVLTRANLSRADLGDVRLKGSRLQRADLTGADLSGADLTHAVLVGARLFGTDLDGTNVTDVICGDTVFADLDLRELIGIETIVHHGPSSLGIESLYRSEGEIPDVFLRGCGLPDEFVTYARSLAASPIEFYSCFLSYSVKDEAFANRLYADLQSAGVRCWFAPEDLRIGDSFRQEIDQTIKVYDKLLVVLSRHSVDSAWVEKEVETAFEQERLRKTLKLFPIRLDEHVMNCNVAWAGDIRRTRHIGDFTSWKHHDAYKTALDRLIRDLKSKVSSPEH